MGGSKVNGRNPITGDAAFYALVFALWGADAHAHASGRIGAQIPPFDAHYSMPVLQDREAGW